jgi:hypothetical protein
MDTSAATSSGSGIYDLAFPRRRILDRAHNFTPPSKFIRSAHHNVDGYTNPVHRLTDLKLLLSLRSHHGHYHEQVNVTVRPGFAPRVTQKGSRVQGERCARCG